MSDTFVGDTPDTSFGPPRTVLRSIYEIAPDALEQIAQWLDQRGIRVPVSQLIGPKRYDDIGYVETTTPVTVAAGGTTTILTTTVAYGSQSQLLVTANFPCFNFTAVSGGDAQVILNVGGTPYTMGRLTSDRQLAWPAQLNRRAPYSTPGNVTLRLDVQSLSGTITVQAGAAYGAISLLASAK